METTAVANQTEQQNLPTLLHRFYYWEETKPDSVYLRQPVGDSFVDFTWREVGRQARILATYLNSLDLPAKSPIGLVSKNCAHWLIADLAIMISGHVSTPFYPTLTSGQLQHVLEHSKCPVLFVGKLDDWESMKSGVPSVTQCITFPTYKPGAQPIDPACVQWNDILNAYQPTTGKPTPKLDDLYTIIYTSGTTGNPKGVVMDYRAMASAIQHTSHLTKYDTPNARFFSYLPLCHVAERNIVEATSIMAGGTVYFAESLDTFGKNLAVASPTHFLAVPRIWTKFQLGILAKIPQKKLNTLLRIPVLSSIVKKKIRKSLGLNDAILVLTGAAPMPIALIKWFRRLGITIQEAYGMTENLGAVSMMPAEKIKDGTVGKIYPGLIVRTDPFTGEIQTKADWNMRGYYNEPELTTQTLHDGWLYTGDVGEVDSEGYLKITGRVKEMYKTAKGEYVAPAQIEFGFADNNLIEQVCVAGQALPQPVALVVLSEVGRQMDRLAVSRSLEETINSLNPTLHTYERVKKVVVVKDAWTVDNNMITPTMKTKRNVVEKHYGPSLESWYQVEETIIWEQ